MYIVRISCAMYDVHRMSYNIRRTLTSNSVLKYGVNRTCRIPLVYTVQCTVLMYNLGLAMDSKHGMLFVVHCTLYAYIVCRTIYAVH